MRVEDKRLKNRIFHPINLLYTNILLQKGGRWKIEMNFSYERRILFMKLPNFGSSFISSVHSTSVSSIEDNIPVRLSSIDSKSFDCSEMHSFDNSICFSNKLIFSNALTYCFAIISIFSKVTAQPYSFPGSAGRTMRFYKITHTIIIQ